MAEEVLSPNSNNIIVHLINPHSPDITVYKKMELAILEKIDSMCVASDGAAKFEGRRDKVCEQKRMMLSEIVCKCSMNCLMKRRIGLSNFICLILSYLQGLKRVLTKLTN